MEESNERNLNVSSFTAQRYGYSALLDAIDTDKDAAWLLPDRVKVPFQHPELGWGCKVAGCEYKKRTSNQGLCHSHYDLYLQAPKKDRSPAKFVESALPLKVRQVEVGRCIICIHRNSFDAETKLCLIHLNKWKNQKSEFADLTEWLESASPLPPREPCWMPDCPDLIDNGNSGMCLPHTTMFKRWLGTKSSLRWDEVSSSFQKLDAARRQWLDSRETQSEPGQVNLIGVQPTLANEMRYLLICQRESTTGSCIGIETFETVAKICRELGSESFFDFTDGVCVAGEFDRFRTHQTKLFLSFAIHHLRRIYFSPEQTRSMGFIETSQFGIKFKDRSTFIDLRAISLEWCRKLVWDYVEHYLTYGPVPRTGSGTDHVRRATVELSAYLRATNHKSADLSLITEGDIRAFCVEILNRGRESKPALAIKKASGENSTLSTFTSKYVVDFSRKLLTDAVRFQFRACERMDPTVLRGFVQTGKVQTPHPRPFSDVQAQALSSAENIDKLRELDPRDSGISDIWEIILSTGRRSGEIRELYLDCVELVNGLPVLIHDQTKVDRYHVSIRIPVPIYHLILDRQEKSLRLFRVYNNRAPTSDERSRMKLFPTVSRYRSGEVAIAGQTFGKKFRSWVYSLEIPGVVPHQARHTMATSLMRAGATLTQVRRYLGHVSDRMAERYVLISNDDLEASLHRVWVAGPGAEEPGTILSGSSESRLLPLEVSVSRLTTPTLGGICLFQPVVDGKKCPRGLNCEQCGDFALAGGDLQYWERKRQQWLILCESAPNDESRKYMEALLEPVSAAIDGLRSVLKAEGLLEKAEALDLSRPQDFFGTMWEAQYPVGSLQSVTSNGLEK